MSKKNQFSSFSSDTKSLLEGAHVLILRVKSNSSVYVAGMMKNAKLSNVQKRELNNALQKEGIVCKSQFGIRRTQYTPEH